LGLSLNLPKPEQPYDVAIIGGGPTGLTAALYAARARLRAVVLDRNPAAGALALADKIENYPGIAGRVKGRDLLDILRKQAEGFGAEIVRAQVVGVTLDRDPKEVVTADRSYMARSVIIATGSMGHKPTIKGEAELLGKGVSYCATCDAPFFRDQDVAVIGGVEQVLEELDIVTKFAKKVYLVTPARTVSPEQEAALQAMPKVDLLSGSRVTRIIGGPVVEGITVSHQEAERRLDVTGVFAYLQGNQPIVDFLLGALETTEEGCIKVNKDDMSTSVEGVFAAGDVTCKMVRQAVIAAAEGCIAALAADRYVHKHERARAQWG
jgi:thioredoxin reductase (NADPH)